MTATGMATVNSTGVEVRAARTSKERGQFLDLPYRLYRDHPYWVPPLRLAQKDILNVSRHPFYRTADVEMFLASRDGKVVGRIMAILNRAHNEFHNERTGFFGFFEVENDKEASAALFDAAGAWLRSRGAETLRGPYNPSTNYEVALLVEGFDEPPAIMMTYNPRYYVELIEGYGFRKAMDLYTYSIDVGEFLVLDKLRRVSERVKTRQKIRLRKVNMKDFDGEAARIREIYNNAWSANWGFVPVTEEEFQHLAKDMKQIVNPNIVFIAEQEVPGSSELKPIGFMLAVPDLNRALKKINGRLLPFGLFKLLWHSRRVGALRVITTGVIREHQNLGVASIFYDAIYREAPANGYPRGEVGWVLETNVLMSRVIEVLGARRNKTYRIYEMAL